ncbi:unnamed protein product [Closterium sp. Naga37s-1]|nr:unnamed protein product [Closterium sp. Naga37s-1]
MPGVPRRLRHRGPDWSLHTFGNNFFAHERLADMDPASGHRPLRKEDGSIVVAVNGEIYNYQQLRDELQHRHTFNTGSDCEVITHMPRRWYSPAWYDEHIPSTPYDPIALRAAFEKAVVKRLMTDVPFGVLLSGGLDSSLVAAVAQRHLGEQWGPQLHSYCIGLEVRRVGTEFLSDWGTLALPDVPFGVLQSGGLDSSLLATIAQLHLGNQWGPQLHSYCIGLEVRCPY